MRYKFTGYLISINFKYSTDMPERKISKFLRKLFGILESQEYQETISWGPSGESIVIKDQEKMENEIIPVYFSLRKFSSFVRQLHLYNFHKEKSKNCFLVFANCKFRREQKDLAFEITRKRKTKAQIQRSIHTKSSQKLIKSESHCDQFQQTVDGPQKKLENPDWQSSLEVIELKSYNHLQQVERDPYDLFNYLDLL